jgi:hypothetical protein
MKSAPFAALLAVLVVALASAADARPHATCRDGVLPAPKICETGDCPPPLARCDVGTPCDGVCTFVVQQCEGAACHDVSVDVPIGQRSLVVVSLDPHREVLLHCRRAPHCEVIARSGTGG